MARYPIEAQSLLSWHVGWHDIAIHSLTPLMREASERVASNGLSQTNKRKEHVVMEVLACTLAGRDGTRCMCYWLISSIIPDAPVNAMWLLSIARAAQHSMGGQPTAVQGLQLQT